MSNRLFFLRCLLASIAIPALVVGPALAGCSQTCADAAACCASEPEITTGCCSESPQAEDPKPHGQAICDCPHSAEVSGTAVEAITVSPTEIAVLETAFEATVDRSEGWSQGTALDVQRGPPGRALFLLECAYLI